MRILLLGGTAEASALARALASVGANAVFSYAGRTEAPVAQPLPTRVGGFGGVTGLRGYLEAERISHVIDATHPFAEGMSRNAHAACTALALPLLRLERPAWQAQAGDNWTHVPDMTALPTRLPEAPARVFLAIGKQQIALFTAQPQHHYLLRLVDAPKDPVLLTNAHTVIARPPFSRAAETALLNEHRITHVVCKNSGGTASRAKLDAARALGLPVIMADRPALPKAPTVAVAADAIAWLAHSADLGV
ncbi:MAG: cobalt-precorrin-6A reductase [Pseudomonadota bacterium]